VAFGLANGSLLIRQEECAVRAPFEQIEKIEHHRVEPARGPGGSKIWLETKFLGRYPVSVPIATGDRKETLDEQVRAVSNAIVKPIQLLEYVDD